jgi:ABC-type spermidine/putrescine transport system permease subunit I
MSVSVLTAPAPTPPPGPTRRPRPVGSRWSMLVMASPPVLLVIVFVGVPIVIGIAYTFGYTGGLNSVATSLSVSVHSAVGWGPTFDAYRSVFADSRFRGDLGVTLWVTVITVAVTVVLAWAVALHARLTGGRLGRVLSGVAVIPLFIPIVIGAYAIRKFYLNTGFLVSVGKQLGVTLPVWSYHTSGIVIGEIWASLPFAVLLISSGLSAVPDALIDAARDAGASRARAVWSVMLPMTTVPTVIVATFTGVSVMGSFTIPYLIGPTAPTMLGVTLQQTYAAYQRPQNAQVMAVVLFALAAGIGALYIWANARASRSTAVAA